jgi:hypothetical protein
MVAPNVSEPVTNDAPQVGASSVLVSHARARQEIFLTNTGATVITLSIGTPAVANAGIVLYPSGFWFSSVSAGYLPPQQDIYAIGSGAGGSLGRTER